MAVDARDSNGEQKVVRIWTQAFASPLQNASSKASGATSGFFRQIINFHSTAQENEGLKLRLAQTEVELRTARRQASENDRLKGLRGLKERSTWETWTARVIAPGPSAASSAKSVNLRACTG